MTTIRELSKQLKMKPAVVRSRLRRELKHPRGARWAIDGRTLPKVIRLFKRKG